MKGKIELLYKIIIMIASGLGIYLNFQVFTVKGALIYYTVQSNLLCFLFYTIVVILLLMKKLKKNNLYYIFKGMITMAVAITMIVYQFFLSTGNSYAGHEFTCILAHLIVPLLVIFDYIIFGEKGKLKKTHPYLWSLTLVFYLIFDIVYVSLGGKFNNLTSYPYFFLNVEEFGISGVLRNCVIIYALFLVLGRIVQIIDQKIKEV